MQMQLMLTGPHMVFLRGSRVVCTQFLLADYLSASSELALDQHIFQSSQCQGSTAPLLPPHLVHLPPDEHDQLYEIEERGDRQNTHVLYNGFSEGNFI